MTRTRYQTTCFIVLFPILIKMIISDCFPSLQLQLDQSVEFSTPMTSYKSLQEGIFLLRNGFKLYQGGVVYHPPLLLKFMSWLPIKSHLFYPVLDSIIAFQLAELSRKLNIPGMPFWIPSLIYSLNPLTLLSCISQSTIIFNNLFISSTLYFTICHSDKLILGALSWCLSTYCSFYSFFLVFPLINLMNKQPAKIINFCILSTLIYSILLLTSYQISGNSWNFIQESYIANITLQNVFPNLGLWWYFFIEMFTEFIPFFKSVFNLFCVGLVIPIAIRFNKQPLYSFILCLSWITLTKPYPTIGDSGFWFAFIPFFKPISGYFKYPIISSLLFIHSILLSPIFYHLWIDLGSGNSNFFYAISLVYALALASIIADLLWAMIRIEYDNGKPDFKLKLTQI